MKNQIENIKNYPVWGGKKLEYIHCEYELNGTVYYRPSYGFLIKSIGGEEDNLIKTIEDTFIQKIQGLKGDIDITSIKGGHNVEYGHDETYESVVGYIVTAENTDFERAKYIASTQCYIMKEVFETNLKGDTIKIDKEKHGWIFSMMDRNAKNYVSLYLGQPKNGQDYQRAENEYLDINNKYNEALTGNIYITMQYKNYLLINTLYSVSRNTTIKLQEKIANMIDYYTTTGMLNLGDAMSFGIPILFGIGNGTSIGTSDAHGKSTNESSTVGNSHSNGITESSTLGQTKGNSINSMKGTTESHMDGTSQNVNSSFTKTGGLNGGLLVKVNGGVSQMNGKGTGTNESDSNGTTISNGQGQQFSKMNSNSSGKTESVSSTASKSVANGEQNTHSDINSKSNSLNMSTGFSISEMKSQNIQIKDAYHELVLEQLDLIQKRLTRGLLTSTFYSQVIGIFEDDKTQALLDDVLVGSIKGGETQPITVINFDEGMIEDSIDYINCFKPVREAESNILEQGTCLTIVNSQEVPFMYPPSQPLVGFNPYKEVPPNGYYRNQTNNEKSSYHHIGKIVDPNTLRKTLTPIDLLSRHSIGIFGTSGAGKSTLACHIQLNYKQKYGSRIILFDNKESSDFYNILYSLKDDNVSMSMYSLGDTSGEYGTPFLNNLFFFPEKVQLGEWISNMLGVLCKVLGQQDRTLYILIPVLTRLYNEVGIFDKRGLSASSLITNQDFIQEVHSIISDLRAKLQYSNLMPLRKKRRLEKRIEILEGLLDGSRRPMEDTFVINRQNAGYLTFEDIVDSIEEQIRSKSSSEMGLSMNAKNTLQSMLDKFTAIANRYALRDLANYETTQDPFEKILKNGTDITIFTTSGMSQDEKQIVGEIMIRYMYLWIFRNKKKYNIGFDKGQKSFMLVMEEANIYFKNAASSESANVTINNEIWNNISLEGRSSGLFYTIIGQNPAELPSYMLNQCKNFFILKLNDRENKVGTLDAMGYFSERPDMKFLKWISFQPVGYATYRCTETDLIDTKPLLMYFDEVY